LESTNTTTDLHSAAMPPCSCPSFEAKLIAAVADGVWNGRLMGAAKWVSCQNQQTCRVDLNATDSSYLDANKDLFGTGLLCSAL
jgi:hypothetical protein